MENEAVRHRIFTRVNGTAVMSDLIRERGHSKAESLTQQFRTPYIAAIERRTSTRKRKAPI